MTQGSAGNLVVELRRQEHTRHPNGTQATAPERDVEIIDYTSHSTPQPVTMDGPEQPRMLRAAAKVNGTKQRTEVEELRGEVQELRDAVSRLTDNLRSIVQLLWPAGVPFNGDGSRTT